MKLLKNVNKNIYNYNMSKTIAESISESMSGGSSDTIPQDGGGGAGDMYVMMALCVSCSTICLTCIILICIISKKSNC
jgi:hypothetical protein